MINSQLRISIIRLGLASLLRTKRINAMRVPADDYDSGAWYPTPFVKEPAESLMRYFARSLADRP